MDRKIVLIVSLVAGLLAAILTRAYISAKDEEIASQRRQLMSEYKTRRVLCFKRQMLRGDRIKDPRVDLGETTVLVRNSEDVYPTSSRDALKGMQIVGAERYAAGTPVRMAYLAGDQVDNRPLNRRIPEDHRAMSISVTGATSVSGRIMEGDHVDVIGTFEFPSDDGRHHRGELFTGTILQSVTVLAVGTESANSSRGLGVYGSSSGPAPSLITLCVTPRQAEVLALAEQVKGRLTLTLHQKTDFKESSDIRKIDFDDAPIISYDEIRKRLEAFNKRP